MYISVHSPVCKFFLPVHACTINMYIEVHTNRDIIRNINCVNAFDVSPKTGQMPDIHDNFLTHVFFFSTNILYEFWKLVVDLLSMAFIDLLVPSVIF